MLANQQLPSSNEIRFYLKRQGWHQQAPGPAGSLWTKDDTAVAVPDADDPRMSFSVIAQLSQLDRMAQADLAAEVKYYGTDVADYRASNDHLDLETIPMSSAASIIENIRQIIRSCATSAFRPQGDLHSHYSPIGDDVWRAARMAHTRQGSFIFPVLVRLSFEEEQSRPDRLIEVREPEPAERRVTRTVAQALNAVQETIVQPLREPDLDALHDAVRMGLSRELCVALGALLAEPIVGELDTSFRWAPALRASSHAPRRVTIPAEARTLLSRAADRLKQVEVMTSHTMTGNIVELRHEEGDPVGVVTISTMRNGRRAEVSVRVPLAIYSRALTWHIEGRVLFVEGEVHGGRGKHLTVPNPVRCTPVDDLFNSRSDTRALRPW